MNLTIDLSALPDEVTDYAFDQFNDRIHGPERESAEESVFANEGVELSYDDQRIDLHETIITAVLRGAMEEKIRDIEYEVKHGERDDFTLDDARRMRRDVDAAFNTE